jgi:hypothetical protein
MPFCCVIESIVLFVFVSVMCVRDGRIVCRQWGFFSLSSPLKITSWSSLFLIFQFQFLFFLFFIFYFWPFIKVLFVFNFIFNLNLSYVCLISLNWLILLFLLFFFINLIFSYVNWLKIEQHFLSYLEKGFFLGYHSHFFVFNFFICLLLLYISL